MVGLSNIAQSDTVKHGKAQFEMHVKLYNVAERYEIPKLKKMAENKFRAAAALYRSEPEMKEVVEGGLPFGLD